MKKQFGEYQRLARGVFGCSSLWRGEDHLLYIRGSGFLIPFTEEYLRIRYRDIQALVVVGTSGRLLSGILYGIGALLFGGVGALIMSLREPGELGPLVLTLLIPFPITMLFLLFFVRTLVLGQRCIVEVQTSLKKESFRMLTRLSFARRVLDSLEEQIQMAQKDLNIGNVQSSQEDSEEQESMGGLQLSVPASAMPTFAASLLLGTLILLQLHTESNVIAWATQVTGALLAPLVLFAISSAVRQLTADGIRFSLWGIVTALLAIGGGGIIFFVNAAVDNPAVTISLSYYIEAFVTLNRDADLGFYLYFIIMAVAMLLLGVIGMIQALLWKKSNIE